jgi:hypothetical protein
MSKNIRTQTGKIIGKTLNTYHSKLKPKLDDLKFKEQYQGRIIDCMVGEIDDNYIETPETNSAIVKLEHSKEGLVKVPSIKGKTILIDAEGNETDTPAEGCRLVSVGENENNKLIILSNNKNLNTDNTTTVDDNNGYFNTTNGLFGKVCANRTYTFSCNIQSTQSYPTNLKCRLMTKDNKAVANEPNFGWATISNGKMHTTFTPTQDGYIGLSGSRYNNCTLTNIQLEEGATTTSYVEPKQHKTEILLDEPLRSLPNGVCDEIVDDKLIRRVGKVTLTGEEGWWSNWTNVSFFEWFSNLRITNWKPISDNITWCSNKLKSTTSYSIEHQGQFNCFCFDVDWNATNPKVIVRPSYDIVEEGNVDQFKEWLKKNNMIILYELAEPIIEELPNSITLQGFDDTTMYIENSITPTVSYGYNALIPYKEELKMQQQEVETNTLDIERNIIPYLMDMEMNLMLMEDN